MMDLGTARLRAAEYRHLLDVEDDPDAAHGKLDSLRADVLAAVVEFSTDPALVILASIALNAQKPGDTRWTA